MDGRHGLQGFQIIITPVLWAQRVDLRTSTPATLGQPPPHPQKYCGFGSPDVLFSLLFNTSEEWANPGPNAACMNKVLLKHGHGPSLMCHSQGICLAVAVWSSDRDSLAHEI